MSIRKFRAIDLLILTGLGLLFDLIIGLTGFFGINLYAAISIPLILFCYVRWGVYGLISNGLLAIAHFLIYLDGTPLGIVGAHAGSLLGLAVVLLVPRTWFRRPRTDFGKVALFYLFGYAAMMILEWTMDQLLYSGIPVANLLLNHVFNFLLGFGLLLIISRQKDLLIPMEVYLKEEQQKREDEKAKSKGNGLYEDDPL